jgi:hypothetical protein
VIFPKFRNFSPDMTSHSRRLVSSIWVFQGVDTEFGVAESVSRFKLKLLIPWPDNAYFGLTDCLSQAGYFKGQEDSPVLWLKSRELHSCRNETLSSKYLASQNRVLCKLRQKMPQKKMAHFTCCVERKTSFSI